MRRSCTFALALAGTLLPGVAAAEWPALGTVVERARANALVVRDQMGQLAMARATREGAAVAWFANPYVEWQGNRTIPSSPASTGTKDIAFYSFAMLPFEINGQRPARIREADAFVAWKTGTRDETRAQVAGRAAALYGQALVARARVDLAIAQERDARAELDVIRARLAAGDVTAVDESLADAELARYTQLHAEATLALMEIREQLEALSQIFELSEPPLNVAPDPPAPRTTNVEAFVAHVLGAAPQLRALGAESAYFKAQGERASRDKWVPLNLIVNFGRTDLGDFQVGGGLSWTLPITQRNQGQVAVAAAASQRAEDLRKTSSVVLEHHARHAFEQYEFMRSTLAALDATGIPAAQRVVDATMGAFRAGKVEFVRVLNARRDLAALRTRRLDLVAVAWARYGELTSLTGELP